MTMFKSLQSSHFRTSIVIFGGICVHLSIGSFYIFGNISPYMISYLRNRTDEHSLKNVDNLWISNAAALTGPFGMVLGGIMDRKFGVRVSTGIGCLIFCLGVFLTHFSLKRSLVLVAITYGCVTNMGSSWAYGPPIQTAAKWMVKWPSVAMGLILCGFGGGALIFNQVVTAYINPNNLSPDYEDENGDKFFTNKDVLDRVPNLFFILSGIYLGMQALGVLLLSNPSWKPMLVPGTNGDHKEDEKGTEKDGETVGLIPSPEPSIAEVLKTMLSNKNSWIWVVILFLVYGGMTFVNGLYKAYGQTFISDDHFLAWIGSLSSIFNCLFRPVWGFVMDRYGFQVAVKCICTGFVCFCCTLLFTEDLPKYAYLLWICCLYACYCGVFVVGPAVFGKLFGLDNIALNLGLTFAALTVAQISSGFIGLNLQSTLGWHGLFLLAGAMGTVAFFISFLFDGKDQRGNPI
ncbi:L-lactate transporter-like isoform X2 [Mya arenaria]|uniref:L-lactate transporter-like isoform X2 n=1 Tax=Mya arenaria TaxID=6604 RepID=UPI0022E7425D|nr:L-lactate transporter-like isoform X2 [Mya arenaria]